MYVSRPAQFERDPRGSLFPAPAVTLRQDGAEVNSMAEEKTRIAELVWLYRAHQAVLPYAELPSGWLSTRSHRHRKQGDYCPFQCRLCDEQRIIDNAAARLRDLETPGL